jgi:NAD-dependent dihydropyrimidine dehydrogenase PreA subunit
MLVADISHPEKLHTCILHSRINSVLMISILTPARSCYDATPRHTFIFGQRDAFLPVSDVNNCILDTLRQVGCDTGDIRMTIPDNDKSNMLSDVMHAILLLGGSKQRQLLCQHLAYIK